MRWQIEGIINAAVKCNSHGRISPPGLPNIVIHYDTDREVPLPVSASKGHKLSGGIVSFVTLNVRRRKNSW